MTEDNLSKQVDEIEALSAIYPDEWRTEDEAYRTYSATVTESGKSATLLITLPPEYPSDSPPFYLLTAPWMKTEDRDELYGLLETLCVDHTGESILHLWIEKMREFLQLKLSNEEMNAATVVDSNPSPMSEIPKTKICSFLNDGADATEDCPFITSAATFTDRKSTFQGHAATVTSVKQVKLVLAKLYENRKIAQATHNIFAYRIYNEESKMWLQDCEDDGEDHAGGRLMHLLQILDVKNVVAVVSRWFGGILLGGDRFKHINNAARDALELGNYVSSTKATAQLQLGAGDDANKKKTKKK